MTPPRHTWSWRPPQGTPSAGATPRRLPLERAFEPLAGDRASSAASLVHAASRRLVDWILTRPRGWTYENATEDLETGLSAFDAAQGWRAPVAVWLETVHATPVIALREQLSVRESLIEELGLWLDGEAEEPASGVVWNGMPLTPGRRLCERNVCAAALVPELAPRELILTHGFSETVALAIEAVQEQGLAPEVIVSECVPDLGGRRMAARLAPLGVRLTLTFDTALFRAVERADRIWVGTEAIGARGFLGRRGTSALLEEAQRHEVPTAVIATSDKLMPRGELFLPSHCTCESWTLWENAPEGVRLDAQAFEEVPLRLAGTFATEVGLESAAELSLRSLRTRNREDESYLLDPILAATPRPS